MPLDAPIVNMKPAPLDHIQRKFMIALIDFMNQLQEMPEMPNWAEEMKNPDALITARRTVTCPVMTKTKICKTLAQASRICNKRIYEILPLLTGTVFAKSNVEFRELQAVFWAYKHIVDGSKCAQFNPVALPELPDAIENLEALEVATITTIQEMSDELKRQNEVIAMLRRQLKEGKAVEADLMSKLQASEGKFAEVESEKAQLIEEKEQLKEALAAMRQEHKEAMAGMLQDHEEFRHEATQIITEAKAKHEEFRAMVNEKFIEKDEATRMISEAVENRFKEMLEQKVNEIGGTITKTTLQPKH